MDEVWNQLGVLIEHNSCVITFDAEQEGELEQHHFWNFASALKWGFGIENFVLNLRGGLYRDIEDALWNSGVKWNLIVDTPQLVEETRSELQRYRGMGQDHVVSRIAVRNGLEFETKPFAYPTIELREVSNFSQELHSDLRCSESAGSFKEAVVDNLLDPGRDYLHGEALEFIDTVQRFAAPSVMELLAVWPTENGARVVPCHSFATHGIVLGGTIFSTRPSLSSKTGWFRREEVREFERLINQRDTSESELQGFFERNPHFINAAHQGVLRAYPQIVLSRADAGELIPDFVLEVANQKWCDLLDIKLPTAPVVVGSANRRRLSSGVMEAIAQLETYRDYFDNPRNRSQFRKLMAAHGAQNLDAYHPRLVVVIGLDVRELDEDPVRKLLMTRYSDLSVVTYGQILAHARSNLLI